MLHITISKRAALMIVVAVLLVIPAAAWANQGFKDVPEGSTHQAGIEWAADVGITLGCGDGTNFCPDQPVTRAQMATFLYRMAQKGGLSFGEVVPYTAGLMAPHSDDDELPKSPVTLAQFGDVKVQGTCWERWGTGLIPGDPVPFPLPWKPIEIVAEVTVVGLPPPEMRLSTSAELDVNGFDCWFTWNVFEGWSG